MRIYLIIIVEKRNIIPESFMYIQKDKSEN